MSVFLTTGSVGFSKSSFHLLFGFFFGGAFSEGFVSVDVILVCLF